MRVRDIQVRELRSGICRYGNVGLARTAGASAAAMMGGVLMLRWGAGDGRIGRRMGRAVTWGCGTQGDRGVCVGRRREGIGFA